MLQREVSNRRPLDYDSFLLPLGFLEPVLLCRAGTASVMGSGSLHGNHELHLYSVDY